MRRCTNTGTVFAGIWCGKSRGIPVINPMLQLHAITGDAEEDLHVVLDGKDDRRRHADSVNKVRINGTRNVIKWIEKRISSQLNFWGNIFKNKPKASRELEIKGKQDIFNKDRIEMMILKGHGEGQIFENIAESDRMMFSYRRNDIEAGVFLERKKARLSRHDGGV